MDKVFIKNLQVYGILGIHPHEQRSPQRIQISLMVETDIQKASQADDIRQTVNYSTLTEQIVQFVEKSHYRTIEALILALADEILKNNKIFSIWLRIEKPNAVPRADSVGVEISRSKTP
jgi:7,8-dihydroneopterin aldolase/epimerase/oxygenase